MFYIIAGPRRYFSCLYNCRSSANDKMSYDKLDMLITEEGVGATYVWSAMKLENNSFVVDTGVTAKLGRFLVCLLVAVLFFFLIPLFV